MAIPNITLAQFNRIASGGYNAGLVDFKTDANGNIKNELKKVDHHVYKTNKNTVVQGKIAMDARSIAPNELGLSFFQSFSPANIINRIIEDAQEMGGDKDYNVDIGV